MMSALRRRARERAQRGAVAVEAALVTVFILVPLLFGIIEFTFILRDYLSVSSSVRVGVRLASANPSAGQCLTNCSPAGSPYLGQLAANAIQQAGTSMPKSSIDYIFVYQANKYGYPAPGGTLGPNIPANTSKTMPSTLAGCASVANCVAYKWSDSTSSFSYNNGSWDTKTVNACASTAYSVGVYMHVTHTNITGLFGRTIGLADRTVMKFEPLASGVCLPNAHQ
jgi:Flp pilus assembly protein TadG